MPVSASDSSKWSFRHQRRPPAAGTSRNDCCRPTRTSATDTQPSAGTLRTGHGNRPKPPFKSRQRCASISLDAYKRTQGLRLSVATHAGRRPSSRTIRAQRSARTGGRIRSTPRCGTPNDRHHPRSTPGRRAPVAAGAQHEFADAREPPYLRATFLPREYPANPSLRRRGQIKSCCAASKRALWRWICHPLPAFVFVEFVLDTCVRHVTYLAPDSIRSPREHSVHVPLVLQ